MDMIWFAIVSGMLATYIVLDGFDLGVGILHRLVARTDEERRIVLAAIGQVWDGNEVWLVATGGVLFMAFPKAYATIFSGFYMAMIIVLWLLILRGVAIAFRSHQDNPLWREFWDAMFSAASVLLTFVFGATVGNLVRGVPLDPDGLSGMPLFTNFLPGRNSGLFDWYTTLAGILSLLALALHGAVFLVWKTDGVVGSRSLAVARKAWWILLPTGIVLALVTRYVSPEFFQNLISRPWTLGLLIVALVGFGAILPLASKRRELPAFLASCAFLLGSVGAVMAANYPFWLRSTIDPSAGLTTANTASAGYGLRAALGWWSVGITLAAGYYINLYRSIRGKVDATSGGHGY